MLKASFCYQKVTEESAEFGDCAEHGWILPGFWEFPLEDSDGYHKNVLNEARNGDYDLTDLSEIVSFAQDLGIYHNEGTDWFYSVDPDIDYQTGEQTTYTLHIEGVTESTKDRIFKLIKG